LTDPQPEIRLSTQASCASQGSGAAMTGSSVEARTRRITRRRRATAAASGLVVLALATTAAYALATGDDRGTVRVGAAPTADDTEPPATTTPPDTSPPTTTAATTTPAAVTTTSPPPTTAPPSDTAPATTAPPPPPPAGIVTSLPLRGDGIGPLRFGTPFADVEAHLTAILGPPTDDTGWYDGEVESGPAYMYDCPDEIATVQRVLLYDRLRVEFVGHSPEDARFAAWYEYDTTLTAKVDGPDAGVLWELATTSGIRTGMPFSEIPADVPRTEIGPRHLVISEPGGDVIVYHLPLSELGLSPSDVDRVLALRTPSPCPDPNPFLGE
jgi:hypothetical protein